LLASSPCSWAKPPREPLKAKEVYAILRQELAPLFKELGFKRAKAFLSWSREAGGVHTVVWCQVSQDGWDSHAGSKFTVEFQRSAEPTVGVPSERRNRISHFLSAADREEVRQLQNAVIQSLRRPPSQDFRWQVSQTASDWYAGKFEPITEPIAASEDLWFRYAAPDHVKAWACFLARVIPGCIQAIEID
jgi:hypothetical protein